MQIKPFLTATTTTTHGPLLTGSVDPQMYQSLISVRGSTDPLYGQEGDYGIA